MKILTISRRVSSLLGLDILTKKKVTSLLLNHSTDITRRLTIASLSFLLMLIASTTLKAQSDITTITTTTVAGTSTSNLNVVIPSDAGNALSDDAGEEITVNYGQGNNLRVVSYTVGGTVYDNFLAPDTLVLNRAVASDRLVNIWFTMNSSLVDNTPPTDDIANLDSDEVADADAIYLSDNLNAGYDNILVNIDDAASGSIEVETERVDVIWYSGIQTSSPTTAVFPIIERGGNDNIAVAAITSLNLDGTPATYSTLIGISENDWPGTGSTFNNYLILRRETAGSTPLPLLNIGTDQGQSAQTIQGVAVSFDDFGIAANTAVFGYSIFPADVVDGYVSNGGNAVTTGAVSIAAGIDLTDISTFPNDTRSNDSGLDLVAGVSAAVASDENLIETKGPGGYKAALATWLKANEGVTTATDGSNVTLWEDQWTGNNDAQTSVASEPNPLFRNTTSVINFNPTVDFGSVAGSALRIPDSGDFNITNGPWDRKSFNIAIRTGDDISAKQVVYEQGGDTRGFNVYIENSTLFYSGWNLGGSDGFGSPWGYSFQSAAVTTDTEYIITFEYDGDDDVTDDLSGEIRCYLNGRIIGTITGVGLLYNHGDDIGLGDEVINALYDNGAGGSETVQPTASFDGEISEFIYCNEPAAFLSAQRNRIESYLAIKYGITLNQDTPNNYVNSDGVTIFDATNNAALGGFLEYNNDIAGIGRDDAAELDQPASRSENTGSVVTIDRGATISTDDTWLIWGNDGAALTESAILSTPDEVDMRLERVWRVAERNETLTTSVSFDITGLGLSTDQNDYSLLIAGNSSAADFSSATVLMGGVLMGNTLTFTGVDLEDGQYFTLGTSYFVCSPGGVEDNLALWLKADEGSSTAVDGADVATWSDQSGAGNDATGVGGNQPSFAATSINFNPAIDFDEVNTEELTGSAGFHSVAYYMVVNPDNSFTAATDEDVLIGFNVPAGATDEFGALGLGSITGALTNEVVTHAIGGTGTRWRRGISSTTITQINSGQTYLFGIRDNADVATSTDMFVDGLEQADLSSGTFLTSVNVDYEIGSYTSTNAFANANHYDGQVGEVISYSVRPTDAEHVRIQSYLAVKYGITLDNSGGAAAGDYMSATNVTPIWDASDYSTYHNDVAGIGRDDQSCLNQKQSQSVNANSIVAIGLGSIETNNAANANTFLADDTFMMWGDDGDDATQANANVADVPGIVTERMERIWRINETNTVGETTVQFDINGLGYSSNLSDFNLIVSSTSTMASGSITPAASLVDGILTFTGVDFADGDFFTIGTARNSCGPGGVTTNLALWLRADAEVFNTGTTQATDGQTVATWADQGINGADATDGSNLTTFETNTINFNPAVEFNNDATSLEGSFTTTTAGLTLITAAFFNSTSGTADALVEYRGGTSDDRSFFINSRYGGNTAFSTNIDEDAWSIWSVDHPSGNTANIFQNGASFESSYNTTLSDAGLGTYNYTLGDDDTGGNDFVGFLGDVIAFEGTLSTTDRQKVETYLAIKYGVTIDQTSATNYIWSDLSNTVIWDGTTNATHNQDIAGIGRDDDSCFSQKQSSSANSDDILAIGLGTVAASNAENVNGFDDNGDYLVWGNDGGTTAEATAEEVDIPNSISQRIERVWKVQDTGTVGETELQFDLTGLGYSLVNPDAFSLLVGNTATMADATIITGGTLNGNILSFTGVDLTDGQFFTVGTGFITCGPGGVGGNTNTIALWLRADLEAFSDAGTTPAVDGNNVLQLNDQSLPADNGLESNLGGGGPIEPTFQTDEINFNPVLNYTDPNSTNASYIETSSNSVSGDMTLISVFRTGQAAGTGNDFVNSPALIGASETGGTADYGFGLENGNLWVNANTTTTFDVESGSTYNDNIVHIGLVTRVQSSGAIALFVDAAADGTGTGSTAALSDPTSFGVGNHSDGDVDAQYAGDIAETIVFSQTLTSDERNRVETYLALKYGITLNGADDGATGSVDERDYRASDGDVIWDFDGQGTTYYNDIFGIGKDDPSCFEQTSAKSENSDALVTFTQPGGSFSTDDSFLISGNDNAPIEAPNNPERPATISSRLNREWRVQETGTVGSIELTYDISTITGTEFGANNLTQTRLLVDDDGDFSNGGTTIIEPTSFDGSAETVTFTVDFTNGQYYTLGSIEVGALPITLLSFEVKKHEDNQVKLDWVSASETNNAFYTIESSTDGVNFNTVANIDGAGNSDAVLFYSYIDQKPVNGLSFYRLKQTDFSGEFTYSELRSVRVERVFNADYSAYPNPITKGETLRISYTIEKDQTLRLSFLNTRAQVVARESRDIKATEDFIEVSTNLLDRGLNLIRILDESGNAVTLKVIVR